MERSRKTWGSKLTFPANQHSKTPNVDAFKQHDNKSSHWINILLYRIWHHRESIDPLMWTRGHYCSRTSEQRFWVIHDFSVSIIAFTRVCFYSVREVSLSSGQEASKGFTENLPAQLAARMISSCWFSWRRRIFVMFDIVSVRNQFIQKFHVPSSWFLENMSVTIIFKSTNELFNRIRPVENGLAQKHFSGMHKKSCLG